MKKLLYVLLALLGLALMALLVLNRVNTIHAFMTIPADLLPAAVYVSAYGALVLVSLFTLVTFTGKGIFRILLLILTVLVIAAGVIAFGFPQVITNLLG